MVLSVKSSLLGETVMSEGQCEILAEDGAEFRRTDERTMGSGTGGIKGLWFQGSPAESRPGKLCQNPCGVMMPHGKSCPSCPGSNEWSRSARPTPILSRNLWRAPDLPTPSCLPGATLDSPEPLTLSHGSAKQMWPQSAA